MNKKTIEKKIYMVVRGGYHTITSKATDDYELAKQYCDRLCKAAGNKNSYYVEEIDLVEVVKED